MKTLTKGSLTPQKPDWVGTKLICTKCRARFELEAGDLVLQENYPKGPRWVVCQTPNCGHHIPVPDYRTLG